MYVYIMYVYQYEFGTVSNRILRGVPPAYTEDEFGIPYQKKSTILPVYMVESYKFCSGFVEIRPVP